MAAEITPTPALSFAVRERKAAGGVMITSSHNPARVEWREVQGELWRVGQAVDHDCDRERIWISRCRRAATPAAIEEVDFIPEYVAAIDAVCRSGGDSRVRGTSFLIDDDVWRGARRDCGDLYAGGDSVCGDSQRAESAFPGINPEPILPHIKATQEAVVAEKCDAGLITDGDADRIGAVDEHGNVVDAHKILAVLAYWLLERKRWPGEVTRAFNTTKMMDRIAAKYGRKLHEHGIGFKYVVDLMLEQEILIGGEESGGIGISRHLPERDGLLNCLLLANVMADEKKTLGQLVAALQEEFGEHQYGRVDMHIDEAMKQSAIARAKAWRGRRLPG